MTIELTRREMAKTAVGVALGAGLLTVPGVPTARAMSTSRTQGVRVGDTPGRKSLEVLARMKKSLGKTNYAGLYSIVPGSGHGVFMEDLDGNVYIDCLSGASANVLGYGRDDVADAYHAAALRMQHSCTVYSVNEHAVDLAEKLCRLMPASFGKRALLGLAGSDSNDGAIEAMRKFTGRSGIMSFRLAYHGSTGLSQAASGYRSLNESIYDASDPNFVKLDFPITPAMADRAIESARAVLAYGKVGGVMVECLQGDAGNRLAAAGFFKRLRELLDQYGALLITDEVQSGMGRTGEWWSYVHEGITPDIMTCGKGLGAGYAPISGVVGRQEIIDSLAPAQHVFTFTGHGPSAAVASKVIDIIEKEGIVKNAHDVGARLLASLKKVAAKYPDVIVETRGRGLQLGVEINVANDALLGKKFAFRCVEQGVYPGYFGRSSSVIRVHPPLILAEREADLIAGVIEDVAAEVHQGKLPKSTVDKVQRFALGW